MADPVQGVAHAFATTVAVAVTMTIVVLSLGLLAVRFVGLSSYVVMGGPAEPLMPIGSLVLVAPVPTGSVRIGDLVTVTLPDGILTHRVVAIDRDASGERFTLRDVVQPSPVVGRPWVAIPTLGYAVTYAEAYSSPIFIGLVVWIVFVFAMRALAPYMATSRRRLPA
jgi:hypothetical protein